MAFQITQENQAAALAALYNASKAQGRGRIHFTPGDMPLQEAEDLLNTSRCPYFDYLKGRVMKVDLALGELDAGLYDRDNGEGAAEKALSHV